MDLISTFHNDFTNDISKILAKQILLGTTTLNKFFADNKKFFSYPEHSALKSYLLNYSIESSLYNAAFTPSALYKAIPVKVNSFGRSILHIMTEHFQVTTAKTNKWNQLPIKSKYKLEHAQANTDGDRQLVLDLEKCTTTPKRDYYYAILTFGYSSKTSECSHIDLIVPDGSFKYIIERKNLLPDKKYDFVDISTGSEIEASVASLNDEFERIVTLKQIKDGN